MLAAALLASVLMSDTGMPSADVAIGAAKQCVEREPDRYKSTWGSPLEWSRASASLLTPLPGQPPYVHRYRVQIPEKEPSGKPQGLMVDVNLHTGACDRVSQK